MSIYDRANTLVQQNTTPFVAQLATSYGYFKGQQYRLVFELPAHQKGALKALIAFRP